MNQENYILEAIELVSAWDLPDEEFGQAVSDQARLMSGINPDDLVEDRPDVH
jgi:hypothetical protein